MTAGAAREAPAAAAPDGRRGRPATARGNAPAAAARRQPPGPGGHDGDSGVRHGAEDRAHRALGQLRRAAAAAGVRGRSAAAIAVTTASPLGEPERVAGRWLPFLRLAAALALTAAAVGALAAAGTGAHLAGGTLDVLRNVAGMTGIGLLCAAALGGGLAWVGPAGYLVAGVYALYTQWHRPALTTPWLWPARPPHDLGAAMCAGLVFTLGMAVITVRGARDPVGE